MHVQGIATVLGDDIRRQTQNGERERPAGVYLCLRAAAIAQLALQARNWPAPRRERNDSLLAAEQ
jgi:hypothetical protein